MAHTIAVIKNNNHYAHTELALIFVPGKNLATLCLVWVHAPAGRGLFSSILKGARARVYVHRCK